jgi:agmatinase
VHVGLRGVGSARGSDVEDSRRAGNMIVTAREVHERGVAPVLAELPADGPVFVSFDLDGLDPAVAPAVSAPAPGGLTYVQAVDLLRGVGSRLAGAVFTEYVPALDIGERTAMVAARLAVVACSVA